MAQYSSLLSEVQLGAVKLQNRVVMSALTRSRSLPTNVPNSLNAEHYRQCAAGGAGLIVSEGTLIVQQGYVTSFGAPGREVRGECVNTRFYPPIQSMLTRLETFSVIHLFQYVLISHITGLSGNTRPESGMRNRFLVGKR